MSYSRRELYAVGEPFGESATRREVGGRVVYGGGGGGNTTSTQNTSNVPAYAEQAFKDMLGRAEALSSAPYVPYGGERNAQFTPMQRQAFGSAAGQQTAPQIGQASGLAAAASQQAMGAGQFGPGTFTPMGVQAPQLSNFQVGSAQQVGSGRVGAQGIQAAQTGFSPNIQQFQMGPAQQVGTSSFTQPGAAQQFMSPFMQNVVNIQTREAQRNADIAGTQRGADAVRAGGFGGSRQAIMDAEAQRNLSQQLGDIQATGSQAAFQQAQQQFNAEQGIGLQSQQANQQAGLTTGQQNLSSNLNTQQLGVQTGAQMALANLGNQQQANVQNAANSLQAQGMNQESGLRAALANQQAGITTDQANLQSALGTQALGAQTGMQAQQSNQQALMDAQRAFEQSRQFGRQSEIQGAQTALQGANTLGQLGQQQFGQQMDITQQQNNFGNQQQQNVQRILDQQFGDFQAERDRPFQQIGFMSDLLRGAGSTTRTMNPGPSALSQVAGAGVAAAGLGAFKAAGGTVSARDYAEGGEVEGARYAGGFAAGGITEPLALPDRLRTLSDQQLSQFAQQNKEDLFSMALAKSETDARARMRQMGAPTQAPQGTVMDEVSAEMAPQMPQQADPMMGGIAAGAPDMDFADGGIVGFAEGGTSSQFMQDLSQLPARFDAFKERIRISDAEKKAREDASKAFRAERMAEREKTSFGNYLFGSPEREAEGLANTQAQDAAAAAAMADREARANFGTEGRRTPSALPSPGIAPARGAVPTPPGRPSPTPEGGAGLAAAARAARPGVAAPAGAAPGAAPGLQTAAGLMAQSRELSGADAAETKMLADQEEINALGAKGSEQDRADFDAEVAQRAVLGTEREKRLKTQEDRADAGDKKSFNMALVEAGLAIMGGQSPNALTNIAEGAKAGVKGFQARLDKYETEKQRLDDARDRIDELRRAEGMADGKERRLLGREIRATERTGKEALAAISTNIFGAKQKQADAAANAVFERDAAARAAALQQASTERTAQIYRTPGAGGGASSTATINSQRAVIQAQIRAETTLLTEARKGFGPTRQADIDAATSRIRVLGGQLAALGPEENQAPAVDSNVTRLRFDAQGNPIQ
jgi:hypothetical protein